MFFHTVDCLVDMRLLQPAALQAGIQWTNKSAEKQSLILTLKCYRIVRHCADPDADELEGAFIEPVEWLARIVLSSATELDGIFKYLTK